MAGNVAGDESPPPAGRRASRPERADEGPAEANFVSDGVGQTGFTSFGVVAAFGACWAVMLGGLWYGAHRWGVDRSAWILLVGPAMGAAVCAVTRERSGRLGWLAAAGTLLAVLGGRALYAAYVVGATREARAGEAPPGVAWSTAMGDLFGVYDMWIVAAALFAAFRLGYGAKRR